MIIDNPNNRSLRERLFQQILLARQRVYAVRPPTPMEELDVGLDAEVWIKREDQPPIHSYKWRGAYNNVASLEPAVRERGVVCASAGNHAQGIALAASRLGCPATIFMPRPTPRMKQNAVKLHGGDAVTVHLTGGTMKRMRLPSRMRHKQTSHLFTLTMILSPWAGKAPWLTKS